LPDGGNLAGQHALAPAFQDAKTAASKLSTSWSPISAFSVKSWMSGLDPANDRIRRFDYGIPPAKNGDYAFLLHILASLKSTGKGAVIHPHGVLFRGGAEAGDPQEPVRRGFIKGIIGLPANLFYGTGIPPAFWCHGQRRRGRAQGHLHGRCQQGLHQGWQQEPAAGAGHPQDRRYLPVSIETPSIRAGAAGRDREPNDFNLNLPRYIDSTEPEDAQDIEAHLKGGIPNVDIDDRGSLAAYWQVFPNVRRELFAGLTGPATASPRVEASQVKATIFAHPEFTAFNQTVTTLFGTWKTRPTPRCSPASSKATAPRR
jgi:type I restriction enzyme M protein